MDIIKVKSTQRSSLFLYLHQIKQDKKPKKNDKLHIRIGLQTGDF